MAPKRGKGRSGSAHDADPEKPLHKKKKVKSLGDESESEEGGGVPNAKVKKEKDEDVKQIAEKKDLDKMYQAMKYQAGKGNTSPLQQYNRMTNKKDKHEFYMKYLQDKKFEWVAMEEKKETATSKETSTASGWMSKFQVADYEKLPFDHPLFLAKLASLPSREHPVQAWRDAGEQEYFYTTGELDKTSETEKQSVVVKAHGKVGPKNQEALMQSMVVGIQVPPKAIKDKGVEEEEQTGGMANAQDEADAKICKEWDEVKKKLQKTTKQMGELCNDAEKLKGTMNTKEHLHSLLEALQKQLCIFEPQKNAALAALGQMNSINNPMVMDKNIAKMQQLVEESQVHIEGFKKSAFKDAKMLLRG